MKYWWCSECGEERDPKNVTPKETCAKCGSDVEWVGDEEPCQEN